MTQEHTETQRVDHQRALAAYLAMGPGRSLSKLCRRYAGTVPKPPGLPTLKFWSKRDGWQAEAVRYDERIAGQVVDRIEEASVEKQFDQAAELLDIVESSVAVLKTYAGDPDTLKKITTAAEFAQVSNAVVNISKHLELLAGRATRRDDGTLDIRCPDWLADRLAPEPVHADDSDPEPEPDPSTRH